MRITFNCPFIRAVLRARPASARRRRRRKRRQGFLRDALQASVEHEHGEGAHPGEAHEDERAESGVGFASLQCHTGLANVAEESVDYPTDLVEVRPCEDATIPGKQRSG